MTCLQGSGPLGVPALGRGLGLACVWRRVLPGSRVGGAPSPGTPTTSYWKGPTSQVLGIGRACPQEGTVKCWWRGVIGRALSQPPDFPVGEGQERGLRLDRTLRNSFHRLLLDDTGVTLFSVLTPQGPALW